MVAGSGARRPTKSYKMKEKTLPKDGIIGIKSIKKRCNW
jgi:hypothetical protein